MTTKESTTVITKEKGLSFARSASTHKQYVNELLDSMAIGKEHDHLVPIIENVLRLILAEANDIRLQSAAFACIGAVSEALDEEYIPTVGSMCGYMRRSDGPGFFYNKPKVDSYGNIKSKGCFFDPDYPEDIVVDDSLPDMGRVKLTHAIEAANNSAVFQAAGVELILTDELLVYAGRAH